MSPTHARGRRHKTTLSSTESVQLSLTKRVADGCAERHARFKLKHPLSAPAGFLSVILSTAMQQSRRQSINGCKFGEQLTTRCRMECTHESTARGVGGQLRCVNCAVLIEGPLAVEEWTCTTCSRHQIGAQFWCTNCLISRDVVQALWGLGALIDGILGVRTYFP
jgi:hypothetical protein